MKRIVQVIKWLLYAAVFFTFFAFALNNQQDATLRFFFGTQWRMPLVLVVLTAFAAGLAVGVLAMVPRWWAHRNTAKRLASQNPPAVANAAAVTTNAKPAPEHGI
jgi:lipopolysaccharide assembly protein A